MATIREWQERVHNLARAKGWYDGGERNVGEVIALMHSELSEALEEWRTGRDPRDVYEGANGKPEGFGVELADCVIRIMDTCEAHGIDLERLIELKHAFNETRPYKHGKVA
jgi:NTP pyrophosphatase (non-canonical NTP hydrolase)